jgi:hypothetical protein
MTRSSCSLRTPRAAWRPHRTHRTTIPEPGLPFSLVLRCEPGKEERGRFETARGAAGLRGIVAEIEGVIGSGRFGQNSRANPEQDALKEMDAARNRLNVVILDACRDNPCARGWRSASRGLAQMSGPPGALIAYATEAEPSVPG